MFKKFLLVLVALLLFSVANAFNSGGSPILTIKTESQFTKCLAVTMVPAIECPSIDLQDVKWTSNEIAVIAEPVRMEESVFRVNSRFIGKYIITTVTSEECNKKQIARRHKYMNVEKWY